MPIEIDKDHDIDLFSLSREEAQAKLQLLHEEAGRIARKYGRRSRRSEVTKDILFEYAIVYHGKPTKDEADRNVRVRSKLLKPITAILARDEGEVRLIAGREIPEEYLDRIDQVEVLVVPFA